MPCEFSIPLRGDAEEIIGKAQQTIRNASGLFDGTAEAGLFDLKTPLGRVAGTYTIQSGEIHVVIDKKPMLISCELIKTQLLSYLSVR